MFVRSAPAIDALEASTMLEQGLKTRRDEVQRFDVSLAFSAFVRARLIGIVALELRPLAVGGSVEGMDRTRIRFEICPMAASRNGMVLRDCGLNTILAILDECRRRGVGQPHIDAGVEMGPPIALHYWIGHIESKGVSASGIKRHRCLDRTALIRRRRVKVLFRTVRIHETRRFRRSNQYCLPTLGPADQPHRAGCRQPESRSKPSDSRIDIGNPSRVRIDSCHARRQHVRRWVSVALVLVSFGRHAGNTLWRPYREAVDGERDVPVFGNLEAPALDGALRDSIVCVGPGLLVAPHAETSVHEDDDRRCRVYGSRSIKPSAQRLT